MELTGEESGQRTGGSLLEPGGDVCCWGLCEGNDLSERLYDVGSERDWDFHDCLGASMV